MRYVTCILLFITSTSSCLASSNQVVGVSLYTRLNNPLFWAVVSSETSDRQRWFVPGEKMRVEMLVISEKLSNRTFRKIWLDGLAANFKEQALAAKAKEIDVLTSVIDKKLIKGDIFTLDNTSGKTVMTINRLEETIVDDPAFLNFLLESWVGKFSASPEFRGTLLKVGRAGVEARLKLAEKASTRIHLQPLVSSNPAPKKATKAATKVKEPKQSGQTTAKKENKSNDRTDLDDKQKQLGVTSRIKPSPNQEAKSKNTIDKPISNKLTHSTSSKQIPQPVSNDSVTRKTPNQNATNQKEGAAAAIEDNKKITLEPAKEIKQPEFTTLKPNGIPQKPLGSADFENESQKKGANEIANAKVVDRSHLKRRAIIDFQSWLKEQPDSINKNVGPSKGVSISEYVGQIYGTIDNFLKKSTQNKVHSNKLIVKVVLRSDGQLKKARLIEKTGDQELDLALLRAVRVASPYPRVPKTITLKQVTLQMEF